MSDTRVILITGAGSGIGKATALYFAQHGWAVGVLDFKTDEVDSTVQEIERTQGQAIGLPADVSNPDPVRQAVERLAGKFGRIDAVFANAGINGTWAPLEDLQPEEWNKTIGTNLTGTFLTVKYSVPHLNRQGGAVIICSSVNGTRIFSNTGATAYSASKAGQVAVAKMLALELAKHKVRVNVICPGAVQTNIGASTKQRNTEREKEPVEYKEGSNIPLTRGEAAEPEEIAKLVWFLASDQASYITGTEVWIDGATSLLQG